MDELTVGLAIVGGLALAGVVAHGAWQARRAGPRRAEPAPAAPGAPAVQIEPVLTPADAGPDPALVRAPPRRAVARLATEGSTSMARVSIAHWLLCW